MGKNLGKMALGLIGLGIALGLINHFLIDIDDMMSGLFERFSNPMLIVIFVASESFLGLIPPDLFIFWAEGFEKPWPMVALLAGLSYLGGIVSFWTGKFLQSFPKVREWMDLKFREQALLFRKFGGLLIFISALTPLPFAPVSNLAGLVNYPFSRYLLMASSRIARFFIYGLVLMSI